VRSMPAAEISVDEDLVAALIAEQYPALAGLPLQQVASHGWDNTVFRIGREFTARLPRRAAAASLIQHESRWLGELSRQVTMPVPVPVHAGSPGSGYPWHWSINRWVPGSPVGVEPFSDPVLSATAITAFLDALHRPAPLDAPANKHRGVPLAARRRTFQAHCELLHRGGRDVRPLIASWQQLTRAPRYRGPRVWLHGDFHGANILAHDGWLSGVIDFGDVTSGDPAVDLSVAWMLFGSDDEREPLRLAADRHGPGTWRRAQAWALALGAAMTAHSADNPLLRQIGERTLDAATVPGASAARRRRIT